MLQLLVYNKNNINHESDKNNIILRKSLFIILINYIKKSPKKIVSLTKCNDVPLRRNSCYLHRNIIQSPQMSQNHSCAQCPCFPLFYFIFFYHY